MPGYNDGLRFGAMSDDPGVRPPPLSDVSTSHVHVVWSGNEMGEGDGSERWRRCCCPCFGQWDVAGVTLTAFVVTAFALLVGLVWL